MKRLVLLSAGVILLTGAVVGWLWWTFRQPVAPPAPLREVEPVSTAVLPTLDTPIPKGKSALWCASFQMAWEQLRKHVAKGDAIRLIGAEEVAQRLNDAPSVADTVNEEDAYAAGGLSDGIVAEIKREMARRFPSETVTDQLEEVPGGAVAYAYLRAAVKFTHPFLENHRPFDFVAADGSKKAVSSFGLPFGIARYPSVEKQVDILHATRGKEWRIETFVLDLCKDTTPYQVLIALIPRQPTLASMLADMEKRIAGKNKEELTGPLMLYDEMVIPHLRFRIKHHFRELEGKRMADLGMTLERSFQQIDFRLDASGATVSSQSVDLGKAGPRNFCADRPFLLVMRKRGATQPFFTLWVENSELLEAWTDERRRRES
jgi:hypothetical protein